MLAFWRFITIVLSALALTMTSAHVLELPQKLTYTAEMYAAVNTTLYRYFAIVGGPYQIGSIVSAIVLTVLLRRSVTFRWTLAGTLLLIAAFVSWLVLGPAGQPRSRCCSGRVARNRPVAVAALA